MKKIDAKGLDCPKPVILTKNELDNMEKGVVETTVDNKVAVDNLSRLAKGQGFKYAVLTISEDEFKVTIEKTEATKKEAKGDESFTLAFAADTMGGGEDELGHILMKSFMYTVTETKPLPDTILFYNSGVYLTCEGSPVLDDIEKLKNEGVEIFSCGTCLDFYNIKDKLKVGDISNMYTIYEKIKEASKNVVIR